MSIVAWIVFGVIAGYLTNKYASGSGSGLVVDLAIGVTGALAGGVASRLGDHAAGTGVDLWSLPIAGAAASLSLWVYHALGRGRITA